MLSKWSPWDFIRNRPQLIPVDAMGVSTFLCDDPYLEYIFMKTYPRDSICPAVVEGREITEDWINENLLNPGFFSSGSHFIALNCEKMSSEVSDYILESIENFSTGHLLLTYSKDSKPLQKLNKNKSVDGLKVEAIKFWEGPKLLEFLCDVYEVRLSYEARGFILDYLDNSVEQFVTALQLLKLHVVKEEVSIEIAKRLLVPSKFDRFHFAELFARKDFKKFFTLLSTADLSFEEMQSFFSFMQSHLFKVMDPSYIQKKDRPSKYDKGILSCTSLWQHAELERMMRVFSRYEIEAKKRSIFLLDKFRLAVLALY